MCGLTAVSSRGDRVLGLLLGTAAGDALGAAFEGKLLVTESALRAVEHASGRLAHTDDTVLSVVLAEHVADRRKKDPVNEGALAGARHGASALPDAWLQRLEIAERIRAVALCLS